MPPCLQGSWRSAKLGWPATFDPSGLLTDDFTKPRDWGSPTLLRLRVHRRVEVVP